MVKALSPESGVVSFLVKGARRKESPFRVALDPLALAEVVFIPSPRRELQIPREAQLIRYHERLRSDLEALAMAQTMTEVVLRLSQPGGHFQEEYDLLIEALAILDGTPPQDSSTFAKIPKPFLLVHWLWRLSECLGFGMRLDQCVECHCPLHAPPADLWPALGGGVCEACLGKRHANWSNEFLTQVFAYTQQNEFHPPASRLEHFMIHFLRIHVGHSLDIHSLEWLDTLRKETSQGDVHAATR